MGTSAYMYTYLGMFDKIAEWIFSGISKALTWLFKSIFGPIFTSVLEPIASQIINMIMISLSSVFYDVFRGLLRLIDIIQTSFMVFAGVTPVTYHGKSISLVELFFTDNAVGNSFRGILILAITLCFVFTIISVIRKMADLEMEQQRSMSMILADSVKSILGFFILPVGCLAGIYLAGAVISSAYNVTTQTSASGSSKTIATTLFEVSVSGAVDNLGDKASDYTNVFLAQANPWEKVLSEKKSNQSDKLFIDYYINLWDIDYVVGYFSAIFLIWNLLAVSFAFVQRIFEIVLLYLVSPFFTAIMPLDGGEKLKKWESLFIAKLSGGMGQIIMVNLYLMLVPIVMNGDINLAGGTVGTENTVYNALIKLIFLLGAAMAVKNGATLFTSLIDAQAGSAEQESMRGNMLAVSAVAHKGMHQAKNFSHKVAAGAPKRNARHDGYKFAKAEKNYTKRMRKADELEKNGFKDEAEKYRTTATREWNHSFNKFAKKGFVKRSDKTETGYKIKDDNFQYGIDKKQHKRGLLSLPHKAEKAVSGITGMKESVKSWTKGKVGVFTGFNSYRKNVKGIVPDHVDRAKGHVKKTLNKDRYWKDAIQKGKEDTVKKYHGLADVPETKTEEPASKAETAPKQESDPKPETVPKSTISPKSRTSQNAKQIRRQVQKQIQKNIKKPTYGSMHKNVRFKKRTSNIKPTHRKKTK